MGDWLCVTDQDTLIPADAADQAAMIVSSANQGQQLLSNTNQGAFIISAGNQGSVITSENIHQLSNNFSEGQVQVFEEAMEVLSRGDKESASTILGQAGITFVDNSQNNSVLEEDGTLTTEATEIIESIEESETTTHMVEDEEQEDLGSSRIRVQVEPSNPSHEIDEELNPTTEFFISSHESPSKDDPEEQDSSFD